MLANHQRNTRVDYLILSTTTTTNKQLYFYPINPIIFVYFNNKVKKVISSPLLPHILHGVAHVVHDRMSPILAG